MRILLSATNLAAAGVEGTGGEHFILGLAAALNAEAGCEVALAAPEGIGTKVSCFDTSIEILPVKARSGLARVLGDAFGLAALARRWQADVLHYPHEWCPRSSCPCVITVQNVGVLYPLGIAEFGRRGQLLRTLARATARNADVVTAVSESAATLWSTVTGLPRSAITVISEGIAWPAFIPSSVPEPSPPDRPILGVIGGREPGLCAARYKGEDLLLEAYDRARSEGLTARLLLAGSHNAGSCANPPGVERLGWRPHEDFLELATRSRCVVIPSVVESFGRPAFEAAGLGVPTIVMRDTPMADWLGDRVTVAPRDISAMAHLLAALPGSESLPLPNAASVRSQFGWSAVIADWLDALRRAASS